MDDVITKETTLVETLQALDREWQADIWPHEGETRPRSYYGVAAERIAELEAKIAGLETFIAKQAASGRAIQRRLNRAGLDDSMPGDAERASVQFEQS